MITARILAAIIGYVCGLFTTGYFLGKMKKVDLHNEGSGNIGTTNALRTLGPMYGALTLLGDCLKAVFAVVIVYFVYKDRFVYEEVRLLMFYAGYFAMVGHIFPITMKFKGGKGIASGLGFIITNLAFLLIPTLGVFIVVVAATRYVSLGSVLATVGFLVSIIISGQTGRLPFLSENLIEVYILSFVLVFIIIFKHKDNLVRLVKGEERKLSFKKNK